MKGQQLNNLFQALAHPVRREILDIVKANPGSCINDVCEHFSMSRIAVMKHLSVLEKADLVVSEKQGRTRRLYFNAVPIQMIHERWTTEYSAMWAGRLTDFKHLVEKKRKD